MYVYKANAFDNVLSKWNVIDVTSMQNIFFFMQMYLIIDVTYGSAGLVYF